MGRIRMRALRTAVGAALLVAISLPATASAGTRDGNHCVFPPDGDFNAMFGITEAVVWFCNDQVGSGQDWRTNMAWGVNDRFAYRPKGFVPAADSPAADFKAKFAGVRIVIDAGTGHQRTYIFSDTAKLVVVGGGLFHTFGMGVMSPLSVGAHHVDSYWTMRAMHCDGFPKGDGGCLPAGDSLGFAADFTVTAGN